MPILDTFILFSGADSADSFHTKALRYLAKLGGTYELGTFALVEFDIVLKSRGFSNEERMGEMALLIADFPKVARAIHPVDPATFYLAAIFEAEFKLDYFDALMAAEAMQHDGTIVSADRAFDKVPSLKRIS
jgi:predicted nucleic acid-binding protein